MPPINEFFETIQATSDKPPETVAKIEGVLLHARARQIIEQKRKHIILGIFISLPITIFSELIRFIIYPIASTFRFFICASVALLGFFSADLLVFSELSATIYAYLIAYVLSDIKASMSLFRAVILDILDVLGLGQFTKSYATFVVSTGRAGCELMVLGARKWYQTESLAVHFYTSRHAYSQVPHLASTESEFLKIAGAQIEESAIEERCDAYWKEFQSSR
jgi:hypothetical protein